MNRNQFTFWIKENHPQITDTERYPKTITTISNHLKKKGVKEYDLYVLTNADDVINIRDQYFSFKEFHDLNERGNNMYSRAFDLFIQCLKIRSYHDPLDEDIKTIIEQSDITTTEKSTLIQARIGQGNYREQLIRLWEGCSVTGFMSVDMLIASHIKPWNKCNNTERLDPYNGLLLLPNIDKAFDKGLISFEEDGKIIISHKFTEHKLAGIDSGMKVTLQKQHKTYMVYHRSEVFERNNTKLTNAQKQHG